MKLNDIIVMLPVSIITTALKFARFELNETDKKNLVENHLYHCTSSKEVADNIIKSGYLRPATGALKTLNSYGHAAVCLFGGIPSTDNFMKNLNVNLFVEPDRITNAVEICIHEDELNKSYKARKISDDAILYEGYCVLPQDRARVVQLVMDLKRDENGKALIGKDGKPLGVEMRKRTLNEITRNPDEYIPKQDYLDYIKKLQKEYGMSTKDDVLSASRTGISFLGRVANMEANEIIKSTQKNARSIFNDFRVKINNVFHRKKLDENPDTKIERLSHGTAYLQSKNPYEDPKYALAVTTFGYEGIKQRNLEYTLQEFSNSENGKYLRDKIEQMETGNVKENGKLEHAKRVTVLATIIAQNEGIFMGDDADRRRDILAYSAFGTNIRRKSGIRVKLKKGTYNDRKDEMTDLDGNSLSETDKKIIAMIVAEKKKENGKEKIEKLLKKYKIPEEEQNVATQLLDVVRDAELLDSARLTKKTPLSVKTKLNPKLLKLRSSKELLDFSYGLEALSKSIANFRDIINYKNTEPGIHYQTIKRRKVNEKFFNMFPKSTEKGNQSPNSTIKVKESDQKQAKLDIGRDL